MTKTVEEKDITLLEPTDHMTQDEILENEGNLLHNLLELSNRKNDEAYQRKVDIKGADGTVKASFRLRPMSSQDAESCAKQASKLVKNIRGKMEKEVDQRIYQSLLIYTATIEEDQKNFWGNRELKKALSIIDNFDMVDALLLAGEKAAVLDILDEMGGFTQNIQDEIQNTAKN